MGKKEHLSLLCKRGQVLEGCFRTVVIAVDQRVVEDDRHGAEFGDVQFDGGEAQG